MRVSLIATVLNEEATIKGLLDSILAQTRRPDEVIIVDGGSSDGTLAALEAYKGRLPLRVISFTKSNIAQGRNRAIAAAGGDIIASTDAGARLSPQWLAELISPFARSEAREPKPRVISGFFIADPQSVFETAMGATVLPDRQEINPISFLPSSRSVAFTKEAWRLARGYPEWLDYCEDIVFDLRLRKAGCTFAWAPQALVYFRPRSNLRSFFGQYYRYARGDGKANLWWHRHLIRYTAYALGTGMFLAGFWMPALWSLLALGAALHLYPPYRRLWPKLTGWPLHKKAEAILWVPIIRVVGDIAKMIGYPVGLLWRLRRHPNNIVAEEVAEEPKVY